jgi:hypothetical protein
MEKENTKYKKIRSESTKLMYYIVSGFCFLFTVLYISPVGDRENKDAPSSEFFVVQGTSVQTEVMNLEKADQVTSFVIVTPKAVPEGFELKGVTVFKKENQKSDQVTLNYITNSNESFKIEESVFKKGLGLGVILDKGDNQTEKVDLFGGVGTLFSNKNGIIKIIWTTRTHFFSIEGHITKEDIIKIAKSM